MNTTPSGGWEPLVTIIVPAYNVAAYIEECIDSALAQSYQSLEVVIVDDGSFDGTREICRAKYAHRARVRYFEQENSGQSVARNFGLEQASGDFVLFLDSDDILDPRCISECIARVVEDRVGLVLFSAATFADGVDRQLVESFSYSRRAERALAGPVYMKAALLKGDYSSSPCLYMAERSLLAGLAFRPKVAFEDNAFTARLICRLPDVKVSVLSGILYRRRLRPSSIMTSERTLRHCDQQIIAAADVLGIPVGADELRAWCLAKLSSRLVVSALHDLYSLGYRYVPWRLRILLLRCLFERWRVVLKNLRLLGALIIPEFVFIYHRAKGIW